MVQHGYFCPTGVFARDFHSILNSFCAGIHQDGFFRKITGSVTGEQFTDLDVGLVARHREQGMGDFGGLLSDGVHHGVVGVADGHHTDTPSQIQELIAIYIDNDRVVSVGGIHRESRGHSTGHGRLATRVKLL